MSTVFFAFQLKRCQYWKIVQAWITIVRLEIVVELFSSGGTWELMLGPRSRRRWISVSSHFLHGYLASYSCENPSSITFLESWFAYSCFCISPITITLPNRVQWQFESPLCEKYGTVWSIRRSSGLTEKHIYLIKMWCAQLYTIEI